MSECFFFCLFLLLLFVLSQAARARALGAIVYCVGVKDFNETQVKHFFLSIHC